jgi:hypothetical protein
MTEEIKSAEGVEHATATPTAEPIVNAPKRRGRPAKNPPANGDPKPVDASSPPPKRAGRPPKKGKVTFSGDDISLLSKHIEGLHHIAYVATGIPELQISSEESQLLAGAVATVAQEYDLEISGKTGALIQLAAVCGMIYVPKFIHLKKRVEAAKAAQKGADVYVIHGGKSDESPVTEH